MNHLFKALFISLPIFLSSCGGDDSGKREVKDPIRKVKTELSTSIYGVGPIAKGEVVLADAVDMAMVEKGKKVYDKMCTACHKPLEDFIGPAPKGVLSRRSPEWVMNMILDPEKMVKEDAVAKKLKKDFKGSPMINQNLTKEEARQVLEYFRTLK
jgi:cytochrome c551/c552